MNIAKNNISVVIPAKNEADSLQKLLTDIRKILPGCELIVVNDGSSDDTPLIADNHANFTINHPISMGNGASVKAGARKASNDIIIFMDADGQHDPADIPELLEQLEQGNLMAIGASWFRQLKPVRIRDASKNAWLGAQQPRNLSMLYPTLYLDHITPTRKKHGWLK